VRVTKGVGLVAACLAVVAACSSTGSSPSTAASPDTKAYSQALQRIASEESTAQHKAAAAFHSKSVKGLQDALRIFESRQAGLAAQIATLTPPAEAVGANTELSQAFADSATAIHSLVRRIADSANVTSAFFVIQSDRDVQQAGEAIGRALDHLTQLGYLPAQPPS
jgi:hypothetical protein